MVWFTKPIKLDDIGVSGRVYKCVEQEHLKKRLSLFQTERVKRRTSPKSSTIPTTTNTTTIPNAILPQILSTIPERYASKDIA